MRPAQKAPENLLILSPSFSNLSRFNEAGAKSAGKLPQGYVSTAVLCASMRPAQKAPENRRRRSGTSGTSSSFNEAGAKSAGKPGVGAMTEAIDWELQ